MNIIDTHCHLDVADFDLDRDKVINRCRTAGVSKIIIPAIESKTWGKLLALCKTEKGLYPALGLHPVFIEQHQASDIKQLEQLLKTVSPVAIGAIIGVRTQLFLILARAVF